MNLAHVDYLPEENRVRPTIEANGGPKINITTDGAKVSHGNLEKYIPVFDEQSVYRDAPGARRAEPSRLLPERRAISMSRSISPRRKSTTTSAISRTPSRRASGNRW